MEIFNLKVLEDVEVKEQHQVKISNRFVALENLDDDDDVDINRSWESIKNKSFSPYSLGYYEVKQHKPWFDEVLKIIRSK
jgi:hypothetical protein